MADSTDNNDKSKSADIPIPTALPPILRWDRVEHERVRIVLGRFRTAWEIISSRVRYITLYCVGLIRCAAVFCLSTIVPFAAVRSLNEMTILVFDTYKVSLAFITHSSEHLDSQ
jgi:hypothetical protein